MLHFCSTFADVSTGGSAFIFRVEQTKQECQLDPENDGTTILRNIGIHLPVDKQ
jgi:hypothetical protein